MYRLIACLVLFASLLVASADDAKKPKSVVSGDVILPKGVEIPREKCPKGFVFLSFKKKSGETVVIFPDYTDDTKGKKIPFSKEEKAFMEEVKALAKPKAKEDPK